MMRKIGFLVAALPLLVACNNKGTGDVEKPLTPFEKGQEVSITSQPLNEYERSGIRKVHVREEVDVQQSEVCAGDKPFVTRLLWDTGDQIDVFVDDSAGIHKGHAYPQSVFKLVSGANTSEGRFSGTMPASGDKYVIMYPHRDADTKTIVEDSTEGNIYTYKVTQFHMPAVQKYRSPDGNTYESKEWPTFASGLLPIFGVGNLDSGFVTYPCGGALRFKLWSSEGDTVNTIRLAGANEDDLSGSFMLKQSTSYTKEIPKMDMEPKTASSCLNAVILQMPKDFKMPTDSAHAVWIYFVLPAPLTLHGFDIYTYKTEITNPSSPEAQYTHHLETTVQPVITQNHITTIELGTNNVYGNINGECWKSPTPKPE